MQARVQKPSAAPLGSDVPTGRAPSVAVVFAAYVVVFAVCAAPWIRTATHAFPVSASAPADERLIAWVLAWIAHALVTAPRHLLDANIFHPAPGQLTGSELFASSELLFAPVFWLTGNATLAASVVSLVSYPLAALLMYRLALALGCGAAGAWVAGLVLALGPLQVPASAHVMQYLALYLPGTALALTRLRDRPTVVRAVLLGATELAAVFSSYYMAVIAIVTGAAWGALELARPAPRRAQFTALAAITTAAALGVLGLASRAYLHRSADAIPMGPGPQLFLPIARSFADADGLLVATGALAVVALVVGTGSERGVAIRGALLGALAVSLVAGPGWPVHGHVIPLPFALLLATPARFFRYPFRFVLLLGFGAALGAGAGVSAVVRRWPRTGPTLAVLATALVLLGRGRALVGRGVANVEGQTALVYETVARETARERERAGVLDLPLLRPIELGMLGTQTDAMVASTRYWLPLVGGFTGYPPSHYRLLADAVRRLPDPDALGDLVDMTHVGWFVLHPIAVWRQPEMRAAIVVMPGVTRVADVDGYVLLRVARPPQHPGWYDAIARGPRAGTTVLGTPLVTVPESDARASVVARAQSAGPTRGWLRLDLAVTNNGAGTWPVAVEQTETTPPVVRLDVRWWPAGAPHDDAHAVLHQPAALARDVPGGETLRQTVFLSTPAPPGAYDLAIAVRQANGAAFDDPANRPLNLSVDVGPAAPAGAAP